MLRRLLRKLRIPILLLGVLGLGWGQNSDNSVAPETITLGAASPTGVTIMNYRVVGTSGPSVYYYWLVSNFPVGKSAFLARTTAYNAQPSLDGSNYVTVLWTPVGGVTSYDLLRTTTDTPPSVCTCAVATGIGPTVGTYNDTGGALGSYTYNPAPNAIARLTLDNQTQSSPTITSNVNMQIPVTLPGTVVETDQSNTYSTGAQNLALATSLTVPQSSGYAPTVSGQIGYDTLLNLPVIGVNGTLGKIPYFTGAVPVAGDCVQWSANGAQSTTGAPCGTGGSSTVASVFGRTGAVVAQTGDYAAGDITGLAASATTNALVADNISSGILPNARLPNPAVGTKGGVEAVAAVANYFVASINTSGVPQLAQPAAAGITGLAASATTNALVADNISSGTLPAARLPNPSISTKGGVMSGDCSGSGTLVGRINTDGSITCASAGSATFSGLSGGTNTTAAMVVGTGASLSASGSGTIAATTATTATSASTAAAITGKSYSGNSSVLATASGTYTSGHGVQIDANGNLVDSGAAPTGTKPNARAYNSGTISLASGVEVALSFNTNEFDTGSVHSTSVNPTRFTVPAGQGGVYLAIGNVTFDVNATGERVLIIYVNGVGRAYTNLPAVTVSDATALIGSTLVNLNAGDYVEFKVVQDSGSTINAFAGPNYTWGSMIKLY